MRTNDVVELIGISTFVSGVVIAVMQGTGLFPAWATCALVLVIVGLIWIGLANRGSE